MNDETTAIVRSKSDLAIMPVMDIEVAINRRNAIVEFTKKVMLENIDYGVIPGTKKDTLLKPGAEKLTTLFGLSPQFHVMKEELDWTGEFHAGEPFFYFQYKCQLYHGDLLAGEGLGSCNSWEKKYRYRTANRTCPACGDETIIKGKREYGGGWLCFVKKGGCGEKWPDGTEEIESQKAGMIKNENPQELVNTIDKMAQKRALVAATLIAVNASEFFTQDLEDLDIVEGVAREVDEKDIATELRQQYQWEQPIIEKIIDLGLANAKQHAVATLEQSPFKETPHGSLEIVEAVAYFIGRSKAKEKSPKIESQERADIVNKAWLAGKNQKWLDKAIEMLNVQEGKTNEQ